MELEVEIYLEDGQMVIELIDANSYIIVGRGTLDLDELKDALDDTD
jgi:hypothetical protein